MPYYLGYSPQYVAAYRQSGIPLPDGGYDYRSSLPVPPPFWQHYDNHDSRDSYRKGNGMAYGGSSICADAYDDDSIMYASGYSSRPMGHYSGYATRQPSAYYPSHAPFGLTPGMPLGGGRYSPGSIPLLPGMAESFSRNPPLDWQDTFPSLRLLDEGAKTPKTGLPLPPPGKNFFDELPRPGVSRASSTLSPLGSEWRSQSDAGRSAVPPSAAPKSPPLQQPVSPGTPRAPPVSPGTPPSHGSHPPPVWANFGIYDTPRELKEVPIGLNQILDSCSGLPNPDKIIEYLREAHHTGRNPLPMPDGLDLSFTRGAR